MKIRIKKIKQIDEISAMGAPGAGGSIEVGGRPFKKKEPLEEDGEFGAITIGATTSINNKKIREPYDDENEPMLDDEKIKLGAEERDDHGPFNNRARNPRPTLHSFEEDLDEGSMMGLIGTAAEPDNGTYHEYGTGHDVGDWEYRDVMIRRAKEKINRALAPFMTHQEMTAHINESIDDDDDMDSIDREFFAGLGNKEMEEDPFAGLSPNDVANRSLEMKGYKIERKLGRGQWGSVYLTKNQFNQPCAVKIVTGEGAERELNNYQKIGAARSAHRLIEKHFPDVLEAWSPKDDVSIIAMEVLQPLNDAQATFLPDASYLAGKNKPHRLAVAGQSYLGMRDVSQRFTHYIQNNIQQVSSLFDRAAYPLATDYKGDFLGKLTPEKMDDAKSNVSPESLLRIMQIETDAPQMSKQYFQNRKASITKILGSGSSGVHFLEILEQESPNALGANAALAEITFRIMLVGLMTGEPKDEIDKEIGKFAKSFLMDARQFTQIPSAYEVPTINMPPKNHERRFLTHKGLHSAIKALYDNTGLIAKDVDDSNIMSRPNGDVVIVDVGLFRQDSRWKPGNNLEEMLRIRKKMLRNLRK